jgi:hypothetical protein
MKGKSHLNRSDPLFLLRIHGMRESVDEIGIGKGALLHRSNQFFSVSIEKGTLHNVLILNDDLHLALQKGSIGYPNSIPEEWGEGIGQGFSVSLHFRPKEYPFSCQEKIPEGHCAYQDQEDHGEDKFQGQADSETEKGFKSVHT